MDLMCVFVFAFVLSHNIGGYVHELCVCFVCIVGYTLAGQSHEPLESLDTYQRMMNLCLQHYVSAFWC